VLSTVTALTEEKDQLQEILGEVREERNQLKRDLEENVEMVSCTLRKAILFKK
jgi:transposase